MFLLCHLITGIVIGLIVAHVFHDRRAIPACAFGAILPDLVDKPLGHILLADSVGYGRIYLHTLLFLVAVTLIGIVVFRRYRNVLVLAAAAGIASHQVLDAMWREPTNWLYPFFGPFTHSGEARSFIDLVMSELTEPTEWLLLVAILLVGLALLYGRKWATKRDRFGPALDRTLIAISAVLLCAGAGVIGCALLHQPCLLTGLADQDDDILCGLVLILSGAAAWYCRRSL